MDELPALLVDAVGDASVVDTVDIGGGDVVVITAETTHLYRSEGLLSDESVETFSHAVNRFDVSAGRRKTTVLLTDSSTERSFTVPSRVADAVIEAVLEGVLSTTAAIDDGEHVQQVFRFSELTLVVTDRRLLKHIGSAVWNDEFESFAHADLTGLDFEEGSVATQVIVETNGRPQRVKVPNEHAGRVREEIQRSVFEFHGVSSLGGLHAMLADEETSTPDDPTSESEPKAANADETPQSDDGFVSSSWSPPADQDVTGPRGRIRTRSATGSQPTEESDGGATATREEASSGSEIRLLSDRLDSLTETVERQTELLEAQQATIEQLVDELRRGR